MVTKEQAQSEKYFIQKTDGNGKLLAKPIRWRASGSCKTWKTRPGDFQLLIKHGLNTYGYLTQDNAHCLEVDR
jgi:hypothetical protein